MEKEIIGESPEQQRAGPELYKPKISADQAVRLWELGKGGSWQQNNRAPEVIGKLTLQVWEQEKTAWGREKDLLYIKPSYSLDICQRA